MGIDVCINEYKKWNTDMPETSKPTIDYLYQAKAICREIAYKSTVNLIRNDSPVKKSQHSWIWEEITSKQQGDFNNYILNYGGFKFNDDPYLINFVLLKESNVIKKEYDIYQSDEVLKDNYDGSYEYAIFLGHVTVSIDPDKNKGKIVYYDGENKETKSDDLVLKRYGSQIALWIK
jgi:hypothetical protein